MLDKGGFVGNEYFNGVIEEYNGKLVLTGSGDKIFLARFNQDGTPDNSFGEEGFCFSDVDFIPCPYNCKSILKYEDKYITCGKNRIIFVNNDGALNNDYSHLLIMM